MTFQNIGYLPQGSAQITTVAGRFDADYADYGLRLFGEEATGATLVANKDETWFHWTYSISATGTSFDFDLVRIYDQNDDLIFYWDGTDGNFEPIMNTGSTTDIGTWAPTAGQIEVNVDIHVKIDAVNGFIRCYEGGVLVASFEGDTVGSLTGRLINRIAFGGNGFSDTSRNVTISEFCIAYDGDSTLNKRFFNKAPTGNGALTDWTGDYTAVDGATPEAGIESDAAAERETFTFPALPTSGAIQAVAVGAIGAEANSLSYDHSLRDASTNYDLAPTPAVDGVSQYREAIWTSHPGGGGFSISGVDAMEFGFVSKAA